MPHKIEVTVVVSGAPQAVDINDHEKVEKLIHKALKDAGIKKPDLSEWGLRVKEGGEPISPEVTIAAAGILDGTTLFLDPDEGGGGELAAALAPAEETPPAAPVLVDPAVSAAKLARELEQWEANSDVYRERGCILLGRGELYVDIAFSCRLPVGPAQDLTVIPLAVRFDFQNYDAWPPSVRLIDPVTRRWLGAPRIQAVDFAHRDQAGNPLEAFVSVHPETEKVFLCKRGVREYHSHFEHSGDDWLLYRGQGIGSLGQLCEVLWRMTTRTVTGLQFVSQRFEVDGVNVVNQEFALRQEDVDALRAQARTQMPIAQLQAQLQAQMQAAAQGQG